MTFEQILNKCADDFIEILNDVGTLDKKNNNLYKELILNSPWGKPHAYRLPVLMDKLNKLKTEYQEDELKEQVELLLEIDYRDEFNCLLENLEYMKVFEDYWEIYDYLVDINDAQLFSDNYIIDYPEVVEKIVNNFLTYQAEDWYQMSNGKYCFWTE